MNRLRKRLMSFNLKLVLTFFAAIFLILLSSCDATGDFTIYFNSNGGSTIKSVSYNEENSIQLPNAPTKEGYTFIGWYLDDSSFMIPFNEDTIFKDSVDSEITVYAKWEINQYTITFDSNGGTNILPMTVDYNSVIVLPEAPDKAGYTFDGWYRDNTLMTPYEVSNMPSSDIVLYAKWLIGEYQISYQTVMDNYHGRLSIILKSEDSIRQLSVGNRHTLLLTTQGSVFAWGDNSYGKCGVESTINTYRPLDITYRFNLEADDYIIQVNASYNYSTALSANGHVFAWGRNDYKQLGDGTLIHRDIPTDITHQFDLEENEKIIDIQSNTHNSAALTSKNRLFVWGSNQYGQLGVGSITSGYEPTDITEEFQLNPDEGISQISLGTAFCIALTTSNRIFTWGTSSSGALGNGGISDYAYTPMDITSNFEFDYLDEPKTIYANTGNAAVLTTEGQLFMWGSNKVNQINMDDTINILLPTNITSLFELNAEEKIRDVEIGSGYTAVLTSFGKFWIWGINEYGQLGDGTKVDNPNHENLSPSFGLMDGESISQISFNYTMSSIVTSNNRIFLWGLNQSNFGISLLDDTTIPIEMPVEILSVIQSDEYIFNTDFELYMPVLDGYTLDGWYLDKTLTRQFNPDNPIIEDTTLYGKWIIDSFVINYHWYPGISETTSIDFGDILEEPENPTRTGYSFDAWYLDESLTNAYIFGDVPNRDITLFAKWVVNQYTITFDSNGGTLVESITQDFQTELPTLVEPTKSGYDFLGWYWNKNNWDYYFSQTTMPYEDVLLEAKWDEIDYLITYELDGGINGSNPINYTITTESITLENPIKDGYLFRGWYDNPSFTGDAITEIPSGSIGEIILYAQWELLP